MQITEIRMMNDETAADEIRWAHRTLSNGQTGLAACVSFAAIAAITGLTTADMTAGALWLVRNDPNVYVIPESNQKVLRPEERAAAVSIGGQHKHWITWL
ncbi:hypothetical protein E0H26_11790 [Micromonospora zingiberis]|uniref:Uncharacterized protein n=1 Tax=Micromonospora zingiberis TaxID=2053011 RepID=A0A4R0GLV1_9ACTN|nr:hypothetical protein [Micromonospora zingiberis]TCB97592.1 hypothetical protein E0H26_11790 [Micromonospora zingiberis]